MNENLTEVVCIIDRSTSIKTSGLVESTIEGFNSFLAKQKLEPGEAKMTLVLFDGDRNNPETAYEIRYDGEPLASIEDLSVDNYQPKGMTALHDAIGRTIDMIKTRQSNTPTEERPSKTLIVIMTDGAENSSVEYTGEGVKTLIETMENDHNWSFLFLGAGIDAATRGVNLGMKLSNTHTYNANVGDTIGTFNMMNTVVSRSRSMSSAQYSVSKDSLIADVDNEINNDQQNN